MTNEKIKICYVANNDSVVKFFLTPHLKFLANEGYDVSVVCAFGRWANQIKAEGIKMKNIRIKRKMFSPISDLAVVVKMMLYFKKEKFDIIHTHNPKPGLLGQIAAKLAGVPVIVNTVHGFYFTENTPPLKRKLFIAAEKVAAKFSSLVFFVNREDMETARKEKICTDKQMKYFGGGINTERFNPRRFGESFVATKKNEIGIKPGHRVVGIVARMVKEKGYMDLFEAFRLALKEIPRLALLVIGPQEPEKKDRLDTSMVNTYNIKDEVIFLGERGDVQEFYPLMDVFVLPSYREGLGVSILEASAMERPVVATNIRGCREAVDDRKTGLLVPVKKPKELAEAIIYLLRRPEEARKMGIAGREKVLKEFDENIALERIKKEYQRLLLEKGGSTQDRRIYFFAKRIFDLFFSFLCLILFSPVFLVITIAIKADSKGPVFYRGERVGRFGKAFKIWKFRTMIPDAEGRGPIHASIKDSRITKIGKFLRKYKLDELPQLINIFRGEMSFVGPRAQVKHYTDLYSDQERTSLNVLPGMTDYATIYYINQDDILDAEDSDAYYRAKVEPKKNELRIKYVKERSFFKDIKIIFQTFWAIIKKIL